MNPLLEQFLSEARESLQSIGERLMQLEQDPENAELMTELFRYVHTLKGNSGLFDFPELTRVLHAGEDLMDAIQNGAIGFSLQIADLLLDLMDFVGMLCDEIESNGRIDSAHAAASVRLAEALRNSTTKSSCPPEPEATSTETPPATEGMVESDVQALLSHIPEQIRMDAYRAALKGTELQLLAYIPDEGCFFSGDDPFYQARHTPGILWGDISVRSPWPPLAQLDAYCCCLDFHIFAAASSADLVEYYRYFSDQVKITPIAPRLLILPKGDPNGGPVYDDFVDDVLELLHKDNMKGVIRSVRSMLELSNSELWLSSALRWLLLVTETTPDDRTAMVAVLTSLRTLTPPQWPVVETEQRPSVEEIPATAEEPPYEAPPADVHLSGIDEDAAAIIEVQREILSLPDDVTWLAGRIRGVAATLEACLSRKDEPGPRPGLAEATTAAIKSATSAPLLAWLDGCPGTVIEPPHLDVATEEPLILATATAPPPVAEAPASLPVGMETPASAPVAPEAPIPLPATLEASASLQPEPDADIKFGRRNEEQLTTLKSLKVDQNRIDLLMNLIGEMVVAKNALPYLAARAESVYGVRELAREIKAQYAVINRIAEELQDSIMQVRMMPVSFVFQRFPRLVRDTSNKLGKKVNLIMEGEETEADKNIIEALCDPLIHIIRNSLDHGIETPDIRLAAGKSAAGTVIIRATQESDHVVIEVRDDGKGIDPEIIKRKAFDKGLMGEEQLERLTDQEAINLVFLPGFSTVDAVSDLSGRGVGMDVVRTAIEKVNGTVQLSSDKGKGTRISMALPLSMAITNVMIVESNRQIFGVPMDVVRETVRIPRSAIKMIKKNMAVVLRGRIVPLKALNPLLGLDAPPKTNDEDEFAVLVVGIGNEVVGILVDEFHETVDIILKPMAGIMAGITAYAGSALLGDGSVLMVLNIREVV